MLQISKKFSRFKVKFLNIFLEFKHNSERAKKNWKTIKNSFLAERFIHRLKFAFAKSKDDTGEMSDEEEKPTHWTENIIIKPNSRKVYYDYFMAYIAILDLMVNIF